MIRRNVLFSLLGGGIVCLTIASVGKTPVTTAVTTVPRAFVSINGSDANPCSAAQPCRSFNQALTVVEAGGEIVVQNSGGYSTGFTITQSVTIDAAGFNASVISTSATDLCTISAGASDRVVLRGISFHGANRGTNAINVTQVGSLYVEHCSISDFPESFPNTVHGIAMLQGGNLWVTDTDVRNCELGLDVNTGTTAAHLVAQDSRFTECGTGVNLATSGSGKTATGWLTNCTVSLCGEGLFVSSGAAPADMTLTNCRAFGNITALIAEAQGTNATMRIANCVVTKNTTGIFTTSVLGGTGSVIGTNPGTNLISGNGTNGATASVDFLQ